MTVATLLLKLKPLRTRLLAGVAVVALIFLLPTMFNNDTALEISRASERGSLPDGFYLYQLLDDRGIRVKSITPADNRLIIQLDTPEQAQAAQLVLQHHLPLGLSVVKRQKFTGWQRLYRPMAEVVRLG